MVGCFASYLSERHAGRLPCLDLAGWSLPLGALPGGVPGILAGIAHLPRRSARSPGSSTASSSSTAASSRLSPRSRPAPIFMGVALFLRPQPGGKINDDLNWALTNSLGDFASTVHIFDDGAAPWFAPFAGIPTPVRPARADRAPGLGPVQPHGHRADRLRDRVGRRRGLYVRPQRQPRPARRLHARRVFRRVRRPLSRHSDLVGQRRHPAGRSLYLELDRRGRDRRHLAPRRQRRRDRLGVRGADPAGHLVTSSAFSTSRRCCSRCSKASSCSPRSASARCACSGSRTRWSSSGDRVSSHPQAVARRPADLDRGAVHRRDPHRRNRLHLAAVRQRAAPVAELSPAAAADRRLPRHRRRRADDRHSDRADRPFRPLDADRGGDDGDRGRRRLGDPDRSRRSGLLSAWSTGSASPICAFPR